MKILSVNDTNEWLRAASLLNSQGSVDLSACLGPRRVWVPTATGRKTNLARVLAETFGSVKGGLLWINEFGIWPSSEYRLIFEAVRQSIGESRPLHVAPGHVLGDDDREILGALLAVSLYFSWGALLVRGDMALIARISHDDFIDFYGADEALSIAGEVLVGQKYVSRDDWGCNDPPAGERAGIPVAR